MLQALYIFVLFHPNNIDHTFVTYVTL